MDPWPGVTSPCISPAPSCKVTLARVQRPTPMAAPFPVAKALRIETAPCATAWPFPFISSLAPNGLPTKRARERVELAFLARFRRTMLLGASASLADVSGRSWYAEGPIIRHTPNRRPSQYLSDSEAESPAQRESSWFEAALR